MMSTLLKVSLEVGNHKIKGGSDVAEADLADSGWLARDATVGRVDMFRRSIGVGIGNFMEWFDFAIYGYFAAIIGQTFFPSAAPGVSLLSSLAVFAVGFVSRPLGAFVLGPLGDRLGR